MFFCSPGSLAFRDPDDLMLMLANEEKLCQFNSWFWLKNKL